VLTFLNKCDRPGKDPLALLDEIEQQIGLTPAPVTWPVGDPGDFKGLLDRRSGDLIVFERTARGANRGTDETLDATQAAALLGPAWDRAQDDAALLDAIGASYDRKAFLAGESSPLFVGSALTNFGVRHLLDAVVDLAPAPTPTTDASGIPRPLDEAFSGFVFKVQANMNPAHRDHVAFVRVCSGHFERGMVLTHGSTGKPFSTKYAASVFGAERNTIDDAWPGDIVGLVNASGLRIGDSLYAEVPVTYPSIPAFAPELTASASPRDLSRFKQFRRGIEQLEQEGVVQVLHRPGDPTPILAAVGQMQFEVFAHRLEAEFGAAVDLSVPQERTVRRTDAATAEHLRAAGGVDVLERSDGTLLALFNSPYWLNRVVADHPDWLLDPIVTT
jgi:peptide chain release factor 3